MTESGKTIMVTGGMGFIGSNFIRYMRKTRPDHSIINFDKLTYAGNPENLRDLEGKENYQFVRGDICDATAVAKVMKQVDGVVHFAAESHVDRSIQGAGEFIQTNVYGTYNLLQSALDNGIERFLMISTDEVYGDVPPGISSKESDPFLPRNPYSASKAGADQLAYSFFITHQLPVVITRSSNNYGPYQFPEKLMPLFITNLLLGKKVPLYGDGMNIRDWLFVEDNCRGIAEVFFRGRPGEAYNIGGGNEKPNVDVTMAILGALGKDESMIRYVEDRKGHDRRYSLDSTKMKEDLGWMPQTTFEEGLRLTVEWYRKYELWWRKLLK